MKQIKMLELSDFKQIATEVKRAYFLRKPSGFSQEVVFGESSWNVEVSFSIYAFGCSESQLFQDFIYYNDLKGIVKEEELTKDMLPMQVFSYGEHFGDIEDEIVYHTSIMSSGVEEIAVELYNDYMRVVKEAMFGG